MTRRVALATGLVFTTTALLAALSDSAATMFVAISLAVLCFATWVLLKDHDIH